MCNLRFSRRNLVLSDFAVEILADGVKASIQKALLHIAQNDAVAAAGKDMRNAVAHRSRADHSDSLNIHEGFSCKH